MRIRDNFAGRVPTWSLNGVKKRGEDFEVTLKCGETIEATMPRPEFIPAAPADAARPIVIEKPKKQ